MEYSSLSKDQQRSILESRIAGWEADHFGHVINRLALEANNVSQAELQSTDDALKTLEASVIAAREELSKLNDDSTDEAIKTLEASVIAAREELSKLNDDSTES